jgi:hypothetical protein
MQKHAKPRQRPSLGACKNKRLRPRTLEEEPSSGDEHNDSSDEEPATKTGKTYDPDYAEDGE